MSLSNKISKILDYFQRPEKTSRCAKERLQIIIAHERGSHNKPDYLAALQQDLLNVITKYVAIDREAVKVELERKEGFSVLELNVTLPNLE
ncbi:MAG: minE [Gammaproteobacteria bacterium]|jgi:cell division topological specificity factor|nr:minE [Gammaproteobacteria bacterium]